MTDTDARTSAWVEILGIALLIAAIVSLWAFTDWSWSPEDEACEHEANCIEAERSLGDGIYLERPDCREVLEH